LGKPYLSICSGERSDCFSCISSIKVVIREDNLLNLLS
jgi:hypothetical protein